MNWKDDAKALAIAPIRNGFLIKLPYTGPLFKGKPEAKSEPLPDMSKYQFLEDDTFDEKTAIENLVFCPDMAAVAKFLIEEYPPAEKQPTSKK